MAKKKGTEPFVMLHRAVINSFAWRALSESARKVIDRVILEWNAEFKAPHKWAIPFLKDERGKYLGTDWQRFKSLNEAKAAASKARALKDTNAVAMGKRRAQINRSPVPSDGTGTSTVTRYRKPLKAA